MFVVAGAESEFANLHALNCGGIGGRAKFYLGCLRPHFYGLRDRADLQRDVDLQIVVDIEHDAGAFLSLEARGLHPDGVIADRDERSGVVASRVRNNRADHLIAVDILDSDFGMRHGRVARVQDRTFHGSGNILSQNGAAGPCNKQA